jgi:hypothetical protein
VGRNVLDGAVQMGIHDALQVGPKYLQDTGLQRFDRAVDIIGV